MGSGIYIATSGAVAQDRALDVAANNIANASTSGYKAKRATFGQELARTRSNDAAFAGVAEIATDSSAGPIRATDNPLDVAIQGEGYFAVNIPNGVRYTRAGDFRLDSQGRLVNSAGLAARGAGGTEIRVPPDVGDVSIEGDGRVMAGQDQVGQLELARFAPASLSREGDNLYAASAAPLADGPPVLLLSGALEGANVNVVRGMVDLVKVSRTYDSLMKMIQGYRDIDAAAARGLGRPK